MKAVLLIGLPGSGKTYVATHTYVPQGYVLVDDPRTLEEIDRAAKSVGGGPGIVIADPHLTMDDARANGITYLERLGFEVECVYFENDKHKAARNIKRRDDGRIINLTVFSVFYTIPEGATVLPIWTEE